MEKIKNNQSGYVAAVGAILAVLVTIIIGVLVYFKVISALGGGLSADAVTALASVNTTANTVFTLMPIIAIVMIAGIVLAVVMGFGRGSL